MSRYLSKSRILMLFKQLRDMISSLSCHADTIPDHILTQMDVKGISDKMLRKAVAKVKEEKLEIVGDRGNKLVKAEFAAIAVAHNIRKMISMSYCACATEGGRVSLDGMATLGRVRGMKSELVPTEPIQTYPIATVVIYKEKGDDLICLSHLLLYATVWLKFQECG